MARKFIASILTAAVIVTGFNAAPARAADIRELAQAAAGIAAVAIIANQLNKSRDGNDQNSVSRNTLGQIFAPQQNRPQYGYDDQRYGYGGQHFVKPRPLPARVSRKALPAACLQTVEDGRGRAVNILGQRCLQNNFRGAGNLPRACEVDVQSNRGWRTAYDATCLSRAGYSIARR